MSIKLWEPSVERVAHTHMTRFSQYLSQKYNFKSESYADFHNWSITQPAQFWEEVWNDCQVISSKGYSQVMSDDEMFDTRWFEGAQLNFAENLLRYKDQDWQAICFLREDGKSDSLTYKALSQKVFQCAAGLRAQGLVKGDRVAAIMPNCPETIIAALAAISIGAIWSSCSPDFGINGVFDRLGQITPKILFTANGYLYNGKTFDCIEKTKSILQKIDSIQTAIVIPFVDEPVASFDKSQAWDELLAMGEPIEHFEQVPFDHPLYILYSSGTTGIPKSIVHGTGGTLLQHMKEHRYHCNLKEQDRLFFFTTCGWMMWNWLTSGLASGATLILYDGSPSFPSLRYLWEAIDPLKITHFGTSPKFISSVLKEQYVPKEHHHFATLQSVISTGSPLTDELFQWVYDNVKTDLQLVSMSGGTDLIGCFALGNPNLPVYSGEIQCKALAMNVHSYSPDKESLVGERGELVCTTPFPSQPIYFWNDTNRKKYHKAYFEEYEGIWTHGDFIEITATGGIIIHGRSDTTLNPGGVRIGTAEIYRQVESIPEVLDSVVVGKKVDAHGRPGDVEIVLFVALQSNLTLDEILIKKIKDSIRKGATPRHVPASIFQVPDIPRTISGKKVEKAVKQILEGEAVLNKSALENPDVLDAFIAFR